MKTYKIKMVVYSPQIGDEGRKTLDKIVIASCKNRDDVEDIAQLLRNNTYKWCYDEINNKPNANAYRIMVEQ